MDKPLLIFDYDGVLVDTTKFLEAEVHKKLKELGYKIPWSNEEMLDLFDENIIVALIERGLKPKDMCAIWEHIQNVSKDRKISLCEGVSQMLLALDSKCSMAIVSSNSSETIRDVLGRLGILQHFSTISGGDEEMGKVERMRKCMSGHGATEESTIYIGDTVGDMKEAREAGVTPIAVAWGLHPAERLAGAQPELIVMEPSELVDYVGALSRAKSAAEAPL